MASSSDGSSTMTGWNRRSRAASFSIRLRYSSSVVAPIMCSSPRASIGLSMLPASRAPRPQPAHSTLCSSSTNSRIGPPPRATSLDGPQRVLGLAGIRTGHQGAHVQGEDGTCRPAPRNVASGDALGQALDDGGLADAGVADQDRVVLGLPGQDLDDPPDLGVSLITGSSWPLAAAAHQVGAVLGQGLVGDLRHGRGDPRLPRIWSAPPGTGPGHRLLLEQAAGRGDRAFGEQRQQQVLDRDVLVLRAGLPPARPCPAAGTAAERP